MGVLCMGIASGRSATLDQTRSTRKTGAMMTRQMTGTVGSQRRWARGRWARVAAVAGLIGSGAQAQDDPGPWTTPSVDLSRYRSVQDRPGQDASLTVAVAISGGGHRASNFAVGVLMGLEEIQLENSLWATDALDAVDYFSTVSGGGFAAGAYISALHDYIEAGGHSEDFVFADAVSDDPRRIPRGVDPKLREHLRRNYEKSLVHGVFSPSSLGAGDRGDFFEQAIHEHLLGGHHRRKAEHPTLTLGDVFVPADDASREPTLPYWFCNATVYANGAIFPFTPGVIDAYGVVGYTHDRDVVVADKLDEPIGLAMPYAMAVKSSASFPGVVPASVLVCNRDSDRRYLHLADGGLADNLGIETAKSVLTQEVSFRKVLIVVDAYIGTLDPYTDQDKAPGVTDSAIRALTIGLDAWRQRNSDPGGNPGLLQSYVTINLNLDSLRTSDEALWLAVSATGTRLTIEPDDQDLLIEAGRQLVRAHRDEILQAMGGP